MCYFIMIRQSYCCKRNSICGRLCCLFRNGDRSVSACTCTVAPLPEVIWARGFQIKLLRHQGDGSDSLFHFHTASNITFTDGSEEPLMYSCVAELGAAQWTDKCSTKQTALFALSSLNAHSQNWPAFIICFFSQKGQDSSVFNITDASAEGRGSGSYAQKRFCQLSCGSRRVPVGLDPVLFLLLPFPSRCRCLFPGGFYPRHLGSLYSSHSGTVQHILAGLYHSFSCFFFFTFLFPVQFDPSKNHSLLGGGVKTTLPPLGIIFLIWLLRIKQMQ